MGLNFDFLALNFLGFFLYSAFNIGLYAVEPIKESYHKRHPYSTNPVQTNDIVFSVHAFFAVTVTLMQCFIYEVGLRFDFQSDQNLFFFSPIFTIVLFPSTRREKIKKYPMRPRLCLDATQYFSESVWFCPALPFWSLSISCTIARTSSYR